MDTGSRRASGALSVETPRRDAVRTLGTAGDALFGALGHVRLHGNGHDQKDQS